MLARVVLTPPGSDRRVVLSEHEYRKGLISDILDSKIPFPSKYGIVPLFDSFSLETLVAFDNAVFSVSRPGFSVTLAAFN